MVTMEADTAAAQNYYGKDLKRLIYSQLCTARWHASSTEPTWIPYSHPEEATERRNLVHQRRKTRLSDS